MPVLKILRFPDVQKLVPFSNETLRRWEHAGTFPKRFKVNGDTMAARAGWSEAEVHAWLAEREEKLADRERQPASS